MPLNATVKSRQVGLGLNPDRLLITEKKSSRCSWLSLYDNKNLILVKISGVSILSQF